MSWFSGNFKTMNKAKFAICTFDVTTFPTLSVARNAMISVAILQHNADRLCDEGSQFIGPNLQFVGLMSLLSLHCSFEIAYLLSVARNAMISAGHFNIHNINPLCEEEHLVFTRWPFVFLTTEGSSESEKNHIWKKMKFINNPFIIYIRL